MRLKKHFENMSIFSKISISTITLIIISSLISSSFLLVHFSQTMKSKDRLLVREAAERIENFMQDKYNMLYNQRILLHSTDHIANVISSTRDQPISICREIWKRLRTISLPCATQTTPFWTPFCLQQMGQTPSPTPTPTGATSTSPTITAVFLI